VAVPSYVGPHVSEDFVAAEWELSYTWDKYNGNFFKKLQKMQLNTLRD